MDCVAPSSRAFFSQHPSNVSNRKSPACRNATTSSLAAAGPPKKVGWVSRPCVGGQLPGSIPWKLRWWIRRLVHTSGWVLRILYSSL